MTRQMLKQFGVEMLGIVKHLQHNQSTHGRGGGGGAPPVPKSLQKFLPKELDTSDAGKEVTVKKGGVAFDIGNKRASKPKVVFRGDQKLQIQGTVKRGVGEYEKTDYIAVLPKNLAGGKDKLLQIPSTYVK